MSANTDTTVQSMNNSNSTLLFILIAVVLGVVSYILIRYWSSLTSEWHQHFNGSVPAQDPALGLSPSDIEAFPTFIYQGPTKICNGNYENQGIGNGNGMVNSKRHGVSVECSICLCDLRQDDVVRILPPCRHFFHIQCIDVWLYAHPSCPICRASLQTSSVALTECSMYPPLPYLHQYNSLEGTDAADMQTTTEEITSSEGITEIVVEQEAEITTNIDNNTKISTNSESIEVQIDVNDEVDTKMDTEESSDKSVSMNEVLLVSNFGSRSKRIPSLGSLKPPTDEELQVEENQKIKQSNRPP